MITQVAASCLHVSVADPEATAILTTNLYHASQMMSKNNGDTDNCSEEDHDGTSIASTVPLSLIDGLNDYFRLLVKSQHSIEYFVLSSI